LEQLQNPIEEYHTVGTVPKYNRKIQHWSCSHSVVFFYWILELFQQCCIFLFDFGTVPTVLYFSIGFWSCSNSVVNKRYHAVGTFPKSNRKTKRKPHCRNNSKI
jgi:hypothetical protein